MKKKPRAKPLYAYAIKRRGEIDINSIDENRAAIIRTLNCPAGESCIPIRISEMAKARDGND